MRRLAPQARFELDGSKLCAVFPAGPACRAKVLIGKNFSATLSPNCDDLQRYCRGGLSNYPQTLKVKGNLGKAKGPYVTDEIPIPFQNPWDSNMRIGAFDFFADGKRAAVCTWNGDVWLVSGLTGDLKEVTWKRYATGLYEPLGLCIVDDKIYINERSQITRLHDLNGDDEADFYECFNNDVMTTSNFHEFTFDLQTDKEGNFY